MGFTVKAYERSEYRGAPGCGCYGRPGAMRMSSARSYSGYVIEPTRTPRLLTRCGTRFRKLSSRLTPAGRAKECAVMPLPFRRDLVG